MAEMKNRRSRLSSAAASLANQRWHRTSEFEDELADAPAALGVVYPTNAHPEQEYYDSARVQPNDPRIDWNTAGRPTVYPQQTSLSQHSREQVLTQSGMPHNSMTFTSSLKKEER